MTNTHPVLGVAMTDSQYAEQWEINSRHFNENGHYAWMIEQLGDVCTVLEVGCGAGISTEYLTRAGKKVVSIEVNSYAMTAAATRLKNKGISVDIVNPMNLKQCFPWSGSSVKLFHGDFFDSHVADLFPKDGFDAIVCWLIGSHPEHIGQVLSKNFLTFEGTEMGEYRLKIQRRCYDVGRSILKSGSIVHLVDRGVMVSWNDKTITRDEVSAEHQEIAGNSYSMPRNNIFLRRLSDNFASSKIQYIAPVEGQSATVPILVSIKAERTN